MTASPTGRRGLRGFRLSDVPESARLAAYNRLLEIYEGAALGASGPGALAEMALLGVAAASPSERVYWIPREAWDAATKTRYWR